MEISTHQDSDLRRSRRGRKHRAAVQQRGGALRQQGALTRYVFKT